MAGAAILQMRTAPLSLFRRRDMVAYVPAGRARGAPATVNRHAVRRISRVQALDRAYGECAAPLRLPATQTSLRAPIRGVAPAVCRTLELPNPALARMLRASRGEDAVHGRENRPELTEPAARALGRGGKNASTSVDYYPVATAVNRDRTARAVPDPREDPQGCCRAPVAEAFVAHGSERAPSPVGVTPPHPLRLTLCPESCHSAKDAPPFLLAATQMAASQLLPAPDVLEFRWWGAPLRTGRMPFYVQCCPLRPAPFARSEPFDEMLAPAFRTGAIGRVACTEGAIASVQLLTHTVATAYDGGAWCEDMSSLAKDLEADLPSSALLAWSTNDDAESRPRRGVVSDKPFAAVGRTSWYARLWL